MKPFRCKLLLMSGLLWVNTLTGFGQAADYSATFRQINTEVLQNSEAYSQLQKATATIGHRLSGTPNGKKAEEFVFNLLKSYGYEDVRYEPFQMKTWQRDYVRLEVVPYKSDNYEPIEAVALAHSPLFADVSANLLDVGNGLASDFERLSEKIKGAAVICNLGLDSTAAGQPNLHRSEKTALAIKHGAVAVIMINQVSGGVLLTGTASVTGELINIPAVCVSKESGKLLREFMKDHKMQAIMEMRNTFETVEARNVVATLKGRSKEKVVVGGHLDSWDLATGAIDNGIGSFAIVEMARTFKKLKITPKRSIDFVLFMGEEQGLWGSTHHVSVQKKRQLKKTKYMLNIDMAGNAVGFGTGGRTEAVGFFEEVGAQIQAIDTVFKNKANNGLGLHSDHQAFMLNGIPTAEPIANLSQKIYNCYHSDCDNFKLVEKKHIDNTARFSSMMLFALADTPQLPAKRQSDAEVGSFLIKNKLRTNLEIQKKWRWK